MADQIGAANRYDVVEGFDAFFHGLADFFALTLQGVGEFATGVLEQLP